MQAVFAETAATPTKVQPVLAVTVAAFVPPMLMIENSNELLTFMLLKSASKDVPKGTVKATAAPV
jgi:hypothetical protein